MIIDQHQLASGFDHPQRFAQGLPARRRRLLVQQEAKYRLIVAGIVETEGGRVALMQVTGAEAGSFCRRLRNWIGSTSTTSSEPPGATRAARCSAKFPSTPATCSV